MSPRTIALMLGTAAMLQASQSPANQQAEPSPAVDRTTAILDRMDPVTRFHSRQYETFKTHERIVDRKTTVHVIADEVGVMNPPSREDIVRRLTCTAAAVFTGTVLSSASFPTDDGTFLFSDYQVRIDDVLKMPAPEAQRHRADTVVVNRPGGRIVVEGTPIEAWASLFPALKASTQYVFFVTYHATTRTFQTDEARGVFEIAGGSARTPIPTYTKEGDLAKTGTPVNQLFQLIRQTNKCPPGSN
jgi:hypothetical protein